MILSPQLGAVEFIIDIFRAPLQELKFTRAHSFLKQLETGMTFQIWSLTLLKEQRTVWLGLPLWWELGTNFPYHRSWWMNVFRCITSKNSDSGKRLGAKCLVSKTSLPHSNMKRMMKARLIPIKQTNKQTLNHTSQERSKEKKKKNSNNM